MELYHTEIGLPEGFTAPTARVRLVWTSHADHARLSDRYGDIPRFSSLPLDKFSVVEVGMERGRVAKIVVRGRYTKDLDAVFVLIPNGSKPWIVKTVWINMHNDAHRTLDRSRYVC